MAQFLNTYRCPDCGEEWQDEWSCGCDDPCPNCDAPISPYQSVRIRPHTPSLDARETSTVLASLRFWQRRHPVPYSATSEGFIEMEHLGEVLPVAEIDDLCERLNQ